MNRSNPLVEIHFALWAVLSVPLGFAGLFFLVPGLMLVEGFILQAIAAMLIGYIANLTRLKRPAWLFGLLLHLALVIGAVYYLPRLPMLLGLPLLLANIYSLAVLVIYRRVWTEPSTPVLEASPST